jgi:hypothetical protein
MEPMYSAHYTSSDQPTAYPAIPLRIEGRRQEE